MSGALRLAISGSSGLIGTALRDWAAGAGHEVQRIPRLGPDPASGLPELRGADAVIHLAGAGIADRRWSEARKREILESRTKGTALIARTIAGLARKPRVLLCASAVGWYGPRPPEENLDEGSASGSGFLAEVCKRWEEAAEPARQAGVRVVHLRLGVVLSARGGALAKMLLPFKLGLGGRLGDGRQVLSWIALSELPPIVEFLLAREDIADPVNAVAPNPASNAELTRALGRVLGRPTVFPMPAFAARLAFGEMAGELLLSGQRVRPGRLLHAGYSFRWPELEAALREELGRGGP